MKAILSREFLPFIILHGSVLSYYMILLIITHIDTRDPYYYSAWFYYYYYYSYWHTNLCVQKDCLTPEAVETLRNLNGGAKVFAKLRFPVAGFTENL